MRHLHRGVGEAQIPTMGERKRQIEWEIIRLRSRGEYLGTVTAPDDNTAVKVALEAFALDIKEEANRLLVRRISR